MTNSAPQEWQVGDLAWLQVGVESANPDRDGEIRVSNAGRLWTTAYNIPIYADPNKLVRAIPTPDPLTELERRVVETAIARHIAYKEWDASRANSDGYTRDVAIASAADSSHKAYREAVGALLVAQAPKDPPNLEAVARAICIAGGKDPDADLRQRSGLPTMLTVPGELPNWRMYLPQARAAVGALEQKESK